MLSPLIRKIRFTPARLTSGGFFIYSDGLMHLKKIIALSAAALTGKQAFAVASTAATAGFTATLAGTDPWPWIIGGFGAAVVYVKRPATTRLDAVVNAAISIAMGGIVAPLAAVAVAEYVNPKLADGYVLAMALSCLWPWLIPAALKKLEGANNV